MAGSQETFGKKEREKKRLKKKKDKLLKKEERRASGQESEFIYVDEFGQLTSTPPDPSKKIKVDASTIEIGIPKKEDREEEETADKVGKVSFFDTSKGFGFIIDTTSQEKYFVHVSGLLEEIKENDKVTFELERGLKGMNAVRVKKV
ncbi:MAG: cold shock domain-containing protein [Lutibacter sp.]|uniref:cold-shock protein n=1 Tax=Lutibacter sp. TaxID=1925666 RepID=UPI001836EA36|nr:cold shock domain-containing protein [Lutibacter sp.]MBT8317321.1 cold shock domain-containing protein [Lutibacter sp.]NNJ58180.1 cold shock domain-containing protein [Lutibacter sp.]